LLVGKVTLDLASLTPPHFSAVAMLIWLADFDELLDEDLELDDEDDLLDELDELILLAALMALLVDWYLLALPPLAVMVALAFIEATACEKLLLVAIYCNP